MKILLIALACLALGAGGGMFMAVRHVENNPTEVCKQAVESKIKSAADKVKEWGD